MKRIKYVRNDLEYILCYAKNKEKLKEFSKRKMKLLLSKTSTTIQKALELILMLLINWMKIMKIHSIYNCQMETK